MSHYSDWRADMARSTDVFGKIAVTLLRASRALGPLGVVPDVMMRVLCGCEIPRRVPVGPGLLIPHGGRGIVVHPSSIIGSNVIIQHGSTLGVGKIKDAPSLGDGSYIGAGARVLGPVTVGAGSTVGANAVVTRDVPAGETHVGIPARRIGL